MKLDQYAVLREKALANFELLLDLWNITFKRISDAEYDYLNPTRLDQNFGACRFNVIKGIGTDFASTILTEQDYAKLGGNFSKEDFAGFDLNFKEQRQGYDVIGLCQRIHKLTSYSEAASLLRQHVVLLTTSDKYKDHKKLAEARHDAIAKQRLYITKKNDQTWNICVSVKGTIGENYLKNRAIEIGTTENSLRFHPKVYNKEKDTYLPALIFKVELAIGTGLLALHRIYLSPCGGYKADLNDPKMALGSIKNAGIWFGTPGEELIIAEGPENALSFRASGFGFVVSTVFASNFDNLTIPSYVRTVKLAHDNDPAGISYAMKAVREYAHNQGKSVSIITPPQGKDWNDILIESKAQ